MRLNCDPSVHLQREFQHFMRRLLPHAWDDDDTSVSEHVLAGTGEVEMRVSRRFLLSPDRLRRLSTSEAVLDAIAHHFRDIRDPIALKTNYRKFWRRR